MRTFAIWFSNGRIERVEDITEQKQVMINIDKSDTKINGMLAELTGATIVLDAEDIRLAIGEAMRKMGKEGFDWILSEIYGTSEVATELGWSMSKVSVYNIRGKIPNPIGEIGGRPVWLKKDIIEFKKQQDKSDE